MGIQVKNNQFHLKNKNTSYIFCVYDNRFLVHLYWGKAMENDVDLTYFPDTFISHRVTAFHVPLNAENKGFINDLKMEFSVVGGGDYRIPTFHAKYGDGSTVSEFEYVGYKIIIGKPKLNGLPSTYIEDENEAQTVEIEFQDKKTGLHMFLSYSIYEDYDVITRNIRYENRGGEKIKLLSSHSACVDFTGNNYKILHLHGDWLRERSVEFIDVTHGIYTVDSKRGMSSHMNNPFVALMDKNADEYSGEVYGFSLVYSGNFSADIEGSSSGSTRVSIGINPFNFEWSIDQNEQFQTPEVVMVYSDCGLNHMSSKYHKLYRERLCRGKYRDELRPMVINNWDATEMDFDEQKIIDIAKKGSELGLELFVLDDGWFRKRNDDTNSVGDWVVDTKKLPNGLKNVAEKINSFGMKFGLWFEPEMVSPDSDLYRQHSDWCLFADERTRTLNRNQLVLDLSKQEVRDYIVNAIANVLKSANIEYIKWDCNRNITETAHQMQSHQYVLGLYEILERLNVMFPDILFESCSGGGGRFDPGILYYMPQTWASDNTRPRSRMDIQYGTSMVYPPITMTAHVAKIDAHGGKNNPYFNASAMVAMSGSFGFECDLSLIDNEVKQQGIEYVQLYKKIRKTVQFGDFYRLESPFENGDVSWEFVHGEEVILFHYQTRFRANGEERVIKLKGLEQNARYVCDGQTYYGEELMKLGIRIPLEVYDVASGIKIFYKLEEHK